MRIVFVNRFFAPDHSATSQMLTDLAVALAAAGADVHVVTSRLRCGGGAQLPREETVGGVAVHRAWSSAFGRGSLAGRALDYATFCAAATLALRALARRGDVVVAMTDPPLVSVPAAWVAYRRGARLVNWLQDVFPEVGEALGVRLAGGTTGRWLRGLRDRSLRRAAANVVVGRRMRDRVAATGVDPRRVTVIENWADGAALRPLVPDANPLRDEWGLDGKFVVAYSGNMGRAHEFDTVLAAAEVLRGRADVAFLFVGDGARRPAIEARVVARGLPNVSFRPYQPRERLGASLAAADVHLVTLRPELEGLVVPSKLYGIAAVGRPAIFVGDPAGEAGAFLAGARCGLAVRPGDALALVAAIETLAGDPALAQRMGAAARRTFDERHDLPRAVARWRALLEGLDDAR